MGRALGIVSSRSRWCRPAWAEARRWSRPAGRSIRALLRPHLATTSRARGERSPLRTAGVLDRVPSTVPYTERAGAPEGTDATPGLDECCRTPQQICPPRQAFGRDQRLLGAHHAEVLGTPLKPPPGGARSQSSASVGLGCDAFWQTTRYSTARHAGGSTPNDVRGGVLRGRAHRGGTGRLRTGQGAYAIAQDLWGLTTPPRLPQGNEVGTQTAPLHLTTSRAKARRRPATHAVT